jgi:hypothetical protein
MDAIGRFHEGGGMGGVKGRSSISYVFNVRTFASRFHCVVLRNRSGFTFPLKFTGHLCNSNQELNLQ